MGLGQRLMVWDKWERVKGKGYGENKIKLKLTLMVYGKCNLKVE